jgi:hypothetical protein
MNEGMTGGDNRRHGVFIQHFYVPSFVSDTNHSRGRLERRRDDTDGETRISIHDQTMDASMIQHQTRRGKDLEEYGQSDNNALD